MSKTDPGFSVYSALFKITQTGETALKLHLSLLEEKNVGVNNCEVHIFLHLSPHKQHTHHRFELKYLLVY